MTRKAKRYHSKPLRDDAVEEIRKIIRGLGLTNAEIYHGTYLSRGTISRLLEWRPGRKRTTYPTFMTLKGVAAASGFRYRLERVPTYTEGDWLKKDNKK